MSKKCTKWVDFKQVKETVSIKMLLDHYGLIDNFKRKGDNILDFVAGACFRQFLRTSTNFNGQPKQNGVN